MDRIRLNADMPKWIYNRPVEECQETELKFARILNESLSGDWLIRWGYWYEDDSKVLREGDFLVMGPYGGIAVFEVKSDLYYQPGTGTWNSHDEKEPTNQDNPLFQLTAQHKAVVRKLKDELSKLNHLPKNAQLPYVAKALALPNNEIATNLKEYHGIPREYILALNDLRSFIDVWDRYFPQKPTLEKHHREIFLAAFGECINPKTIRKFVSETDKFILQQTKAGYQLLDMLSQNRQLLVQGGVGTGKTWMALECAYRFAANQGGDAGRDVLMIAYNNALYEKLRHIVTRKKLERGSITVKNTEAIAADILKVEDFDNEVPEDPRQKAHYYEHVLPSLAYDCLKSIRNDPAKSPQLKGYDALVVDEAQDQDTNWPGDEPTEDRVGWWSVYVMLLKDGWNAPMALFGDSAQRPPFRGVDRFEWSRLRERMSQHVFVELKQVVRYTRQIYCFLKRLDKKGADHLVAGLQHTGPLQDGPEVELLDAGQDELGQKIEDLLDRWDEEGWCRPGQVLLLYERSEIQNSALAGLAELCDHPLRPYLDTMGNAKGEEDKKSGECIKHSSVHKAKGLDELAVVMVVKRRYEDLESEQDRYTYFMGASRARQLLAVVHTAYDS